MKFGNTPLKKLNIKGLENYAIYAKLESYNPSESVKDRMVIPIVIQAIQRRELKTGMTIIEATTGNTGIALSYIAKELGYRFIAVMPENNSQERVQIMQQNGAEVILTPSEEGPQGAIDRRDKLLNLSSDYWSPRQFTNPLNVEAQSESLGNELLRDFKRLGIKPVFFVHGIGTGGTLVGVAKKLKEVFPRVKVIAVEPEESSVLQGGRSGSHGIQGIGEGFIPDIVDMNAIDKVVSVTTIDAQNQMRNFYNDSGISLGVSSGANLAAIKKLFLSEHIRPEDSIITIFADGVGRYTSLLEDLNREVYL